MSEIGKAHSPEVQAMMQRIRAATLMGGVGDSEDVASFAKHVLALTAERDALKAENERLRFIRTDLASELIQALKQLHDADDCNDLERSGRIAELELALEMSA